MTGFPRVAEFGAGLLALHPGAVLINYTASPAAQEFKKEPNYSDNRSVPTETFLV